MIKEFQRLKEAENDVKKIEWDAKRFLSKNNYLIQTDAVKNYLIPSRNYKENLEWLAYAEEAVVYTYRIPFLMILILMDYFSQYKYRLVEIQQLAQTHFRDWVGYANAIKATDCFIRNCVYPDLLPDSDEERAAFGYALFWMAKRNLAITLLFSSNEIVKSVCTGEIQSCADAIRGLFEHPTLSDSYQSAVEEIVKRLIFEMRIISFSVTDDEVNCKFVPSFLTEETTSENKNENQYVSEIDEMRCNVNELILETIKLIDDIYKKGHFTKDRWKRIEERIKIFRTHIFSENRLPFFAVDPYCLYSEGSSRQPIAEYFPMQQLLSVGKYEKFRKLLNRVYASLDNFFN